MLIEFYFTPELHLKDGHIIRDLNDAASFAREQEVRPGVDQRDEVLHKIERAQTPPGSPLARQALCSTPTQGLTAACPRSTRGAIRPYLAVLVISSWWVVNLRPLAMS